MWTEDELRDELYRTTISYMDQYKVAMEEALRVVKPQFLTRKRAQLRDRLKGGVTGETQLEGFDPGRSDFRNATDSLATQFTSSVKEGIQTGSIPSAVAGVENALSGDPDRPFLDKYREGASTLRETAALEKAETYKQAGIVDDDRSRLVEGAGSFTGMALDPVLWGMPEVGAINKTVKGLKPVVKEVSKHIGRNLPYDVAAGALAQAMKSGELPTTGTIGEEVIAAVVGRNLMHGGAATVRSVRDGLVERFRLKPHQVETLESTGRVELDPEQDATERLTRAIAADSEHSLADRMDPQNPQRELVARAEKLGVALDLDTRIAIVRGEVQPLSGAAEAKVREGIAEASERYMRGIESAFRELGVELTGVQKKALRLGEMPVFTPKQADGADASLGQWISAKLDALERNGIDVDNIPSNPRRVEQQVVVREDPMGRYEDLVDVDVEDVMGGSLARMQWYIEASKVLYRERVRWHELAENANFKWNEEQLNDIKRNIEPQPNSEQRFKIDLYQKTINPPPQLPFWKSLANKIFYQAFRNMPEALIHHPGKIHQEAGRRLLHTMRDADMFKQQLDDWLSSTGAKDWNKMDRMVAARVMHGVAGPREMQELFQRNPGAQSVLQNARQTLDWISNFLEQNGAKTTLPGGKKVPYRRIENYFPIPPEKVGDPTYNTVYWEAGAKEVGRRKQLMIPKDATDVDFVKDLQYYIEWISEQMAQTRHFGGDLDETLTTMVRMAVKEGEDPDNLRRIVSTALGERLNVEQVFGRAMSFLRSAYVAGNIWMAAPSQISQIGNAIYKAGFKGVWESLPEIMKVVRREPEMMKLLHESGITYERMSHSLMREVNVRQNNGVPPPPDETTFMSTVADLSVKYSGVGPIDGALRYMTAPIGFHYVKKLAKALVSGDEGYIKRMGLTVEKAQQELRLAGIQDPARLVNTGELTLSEAKNVAWWWSREVNMGQTTKDSPEIMARLGKLGSLLWVFRRFGLAQADFFARTVAKPAMKGNLRPLARWLAVAPVLGIPQVEISDWLQNRESTVAENLPKYYLAGSTGMFYTVFQSMQYGLDLLVPDAAIDWAMDIGSAGLEPVGTLLETGSPVEAVKEIPGAGLKAAREAAMPVDIAMNLYEKTQ